MPSVSLCIGHAINRRAAGGAIGFRSAADVSKGFAFLRLHATHMRLAQHHANFFCETGRTARWICALFGFVSLAWSSRAAASEANLILPDLSSVPLLRQIDGRALLIWGIAICALGLLFGLWQYMGLKRLPVHRAMLEISELIY